MCVTVSSSKNIVVKCHEVESARTLWYTVVVRCHEVESARTLWYTVVVRCHEVESARTLWYTVVVRCHEVESARTLWYTVVVRCHEVESATSTDMVHVLCSANYAVVTSTVNANLNSQSNNWLLHLSLVACQMTHQYCLPKLTDIGPCLMELFQKWTQFRVVLLAAHVWCTLRLCSQWLIRPFVYHACVCVDV